MLKYVINSSRIKLQPGYVADGWLGLILGSKIYVNFTKYDWKVCMDKLVSEIKSITSNDNKVPKPSDPDKGTGTANPDPDANAGGKKPDKWNNAVRDFIFLALQKIYNI